MLNLTLLGPVRVTQAPGTRPENTAGTPRPRFRSRRTIALLGYLAIERRPIAREYLAAFFWPDEEPAQGRGKLRRELYNLAQVLPGCWQTEPQAIAFFPAGDIGVDIDLLPRLQQAQRWQEAAHLLAGEFLEGVYLPDNQRFESWLLAERERWRERSCAILHQATTELCGHGRFADALPAARRLLQLTPWDEETQRQVMRLLAWTGRREEALRQFAACRQALASELGVEPVAETVALYQQIKVGALQPPPPPPAYLSAAARNEVDGQALFVMRERQLAWLDGHLQRALAGQGGIVFITGGAGLGKTALLDAFARLELEAHPDLLIARGSGAAYAGAGDPYQPFRDIMTMLSGEVEARWSAGVISTAHARRLWQAVPLFVQSIVAHGPGLIDIFVAGAALLNRAQAAAPGHAPWVQRLDDHLRLHPAETSAARQSALFEQFSNVLRALSARHPLLLFLDDLQWIDAASISLLFHLLRRISSNGSKILIVGAYRPDEIMRHHGGARHQLARALSEFKRMFGDVFLSLHWTNEVEGRHFVDSILDSEPNNLGQDFRAALFYRTGGHPLFTLELLRALRDRGSLIRDASGRWQEGLQHDWQMIPARVEAVIAESIQQLEPELQELLAVASVEGELFTAEVIAEVLDQPPKQLLRRLAQELGIKQRLVHEQEAYQIDNRLVTRFSFRHALFQEYLYRQLTAGESRLLHGSVAVAIERVYAPELGAWSVQLAQHFDQAGNYRQALYYYTMAAENAARVYAYEETIAHYQRAIALSKLAVASPQVQVQLYHGRGLAFETKGHFDLARADFERALDLSQAAGEKLLEWQIVLALGKLWPSRDYNRAREYLQRALELAREMADPVILGRSLNRYGNWLANDEHPVLALTYHREALQIFEELDDRPNLANTLDLLGIVCLLRGDSSASAATNYNRAIQLFRELGHYPRLISSLTAQALIAAAPLMLAATQMIVPADPFANLNEALQIAQRIGSTPDEAWCAWAEALLFTVHGDFGRALEASRRGLQIAANINHSEWQVGNRYALGIVYNELLQPELALPELAPALELARELRSQYWVNHVSSALAKSHRLLGNLAEAQSCLDAVITAGTEMDTAGKRYCWLRRAELALARDDPSQALNLCAELVRSAPGLEPGGVITIFWLLNGEVLAALGRPAEALEWLEAGFTAAHERQEFFHLWRYRAALARVYRASGRQAAAEQQLAAARQLVTKLASSVNDEPLRAAFQRRAFEQLACGCF